MAQAAKATMKVIKYGAGACLIGYIGYESLYNSTLGLILPIVECTIS